MLVDAHNHLDFFENPSEIIDLIEKNSIKTIAVSIDYESYIKNLSLRDSDYLIKTFGIHPWKVKEPIDLDKYADIIKNTPMIGEIGLDFHWVEDKNLYKNQIKVFEDFLKMAKKYDKIVNIHTKGGEEEVYNLLKVYDVKSIIHWYSGPIDIFEKLKDLDTSFTISVDAGYSDLTDKIIDGLPVSKMLTETDGAGAMEWIDKSKKSSPLLVKEILAYIAKRKNIAYDELRHIVYNNYLNLNI